MSWGRAFGRRRLPPRGPPPSAMIAAPVFAFGLAKKTLLADTVAPYADAVFGAVFAAVQTDMKRLLAYSSINNVGFMLVGLTAVPLRLRWVL